MSNNDFRKSFVKRHSSILFLVSLLLFGIIVLLLGHKLSSSTQAIQVSVGAILLQQSSALIAVALTAFFFSLPDLREYISGILGDLLSRGSIVDYFPEKTKIDLWNRLAYNLASPNIKRIEPTLSKHLYSTVYSSVESPYATNYKYTVDIRDNNDTPNLINHYATCFYRLHGHHIADDIIIPYRFFQSATFPVDSTPSYEEWLCTCEINLGSASYDRSGLKFSTETLGRANILSAVFEKELILNDHIDINTVVEILNPSADKVQILWARYPTQGFHVEFRYNDRFLYDCAWFKHCVPEEDAPSRGNVVTFHNGISASTSDWLMPGEGVSIYYYPAS